MYKLAASGTENGGLKFYNEILYFKFRIPTF